MPVMRSHVFALTLAALMAGCGGGGAGDETAAPGDDDTAVPAPPDSPAPTPPAPTLPAPPPDPPAPSPPDPPAPSPPPPTPPPDPPTPPATNTSPVANAGADKTTVEEQDVTIDGSGTRDANNDPIEYRWQLLSGPAGSQVKVNATSASFVFRPDLPGVYELRLTADDGRESSSDTMRVTADELFELGAGASFKIDAASQAGSDRLALRLKASPHYRGSPVAFTASGNVQWLSLSPATGTLGVPGADAVVGLQLDIEELGRLANGTHEARVTITPAGGWSAVSTTVSLELLLPIVHRVLPYVAYVGTFQRVTLYGEHLSGANGHSLFINGVEALNLSAPTDDRATIDLPPLPAGTYTVRIGHALDVAREMARVVVRDAPSYDDADVPLPGPTWSIEYDAERDSVYGVFGTSDGDVARRFRRVEGAWRADPIDLPDRPIDVALTADGQELIVTAGCKIHQLNPETLAIVRTTDSGCVGFFEFIVALADGRVLLVDSGDWLSSSVWEFPAMTRSELLPAAILPLAILNYERNRMLWAEQPPTHQEWELYHYDVGSSAAKLVNPHGTPVYMHDTLAISGDGSRTLHITDLYDEEFRFIGTLDVPFPQVEGVVPGLGRDGKRAFVVHCDADAILTHDLTAPGPIFPMIGSSIALPADLACHGGTLIVIPPTESAAFVFASARSTAGPFEPVDTFMLYIRRLP